MALSSVPVYSGYIWMWPAFSALKMISEEPMFSVRLTLKPFAFSACV